MLNLKIVVGSTREGRASDRVVPWVARRAGSIDAFATEVIDLREWALPMFAETAHTVGDFANPTRRCRPVPPRGRGTRGVADGLSGGEHTGPSRAPGRATRRAASIVGPGAVAMRRTYVNAKVCSGRCR